MTRDLWQDRLSEYIDGELSAQESAALEAHITSCNDCTDILEALRHVKEAARVLEDRPAPPERWDAIPSAISAASVSEPKVVDIATRRAARRWSFTVPQIAVAALGLMLLSGGGAWLALSGGGPDAAPVTAANEQEQIVRPVATSGRAEQDLDHAVADLETLLEAGRTKLSPKTIATIETNLKIVDQAIAEARVALEQDPNSEFLNAYLAESMRRKMSLVRQSTSILRAST